MRKTSENSKQASKQANNNNSKKAFHSLAIHKTVIVHMVRDIAAVVLKTETPKS